VPKAVVRSARKHLDKLEISSPPMTAQGGLFDQTVAATAPEPHPVMDALAELQPDELSPRDALDKLYQLKRLLDANS